MLGFYTSDIGTLNQVVHMWGYDSHAERDRRRALLAIASEWRAFVPKVLPLIRDMENRILVPAPAQCDAKCVQLAEGVDKAGRREMRGHRAGHAMTNKLLRALFAQPDAWEWVILTPDMESRLPGAGVIASAAHLVHASRQLAVA